MAYSLVQDEPQDNDVITQVGDRKFLVQDDIANDVNSFEIDYHNGWIRKAFVVFPN